MAWLKQAYFRYGPAAGDLLWRTYLIIDELRTSQKAGSDLKMDLLDDAIRHLRDVKDTATEGKAGAVFDNPSYQRSDENKGENGAFDANNPVDRKTNTEVNPGPVSLVPGMPHTISPDVLSD